MNPILIFIARDGNIRTIDRIDCAYTNIIGVYQAYETIVWGRGGE